MLEATLKDDMINLLNAINHSNFVSYVCGKTFNCVGGNLRINTSQGSVELTNFHKTIPFFDEEDEVAFFECVRVNTTTAFVPYCNIPAENFDINEKIKSIEIINDYINVNNGKYEFSFDQAIIFKTEHRTIMFSRNAWFSEVIIISDTDDYDSVFPISEVSQTFSNYGEYSVNVKRTRRVL